MKKLFLLFAVALFVAGCATSDTAKPDEKQQNVELVKSVMEAQKITFEKLEASKGITPATRAAVDTMTVERFGDWWPLCGTRRAAIIRQIMEDKGVTLEDLK